LKLIEALVDPARLGEVKEALSAVEVFRMTVSDVTGLQRSSDSADWQPSTLVRLEIAVNEDFVQPTLAAIRSAGGEGDATGDRGDGTETEGADDGQRIHVHTLKDVIRVRTGERGPEAI
jgi:nitrogen regulatory protein P-II 1